MPDSSKSLPSGETAASALLTRHNTARPDLPAEAKRGRNDPFPDLEILWVSKDEIDDATRRLRRAARTQVETVKRSIERFGNRIPILVKRKDCKIRYEVVDGHSRLAAARLLGAEKLPCIVVDDLPDAEIRRLALTLNKTQETGECSDAPGVTGALVQASAVGADDAQRAPDAHEDLLFGDELGLDG